MNNKNIFISCGEVSGDIYAGDFIREILKLIPDLEIWGMMGFNGEKSGGTVTWSYDELKLMGFIEIIPALPRIFKLKNEMTREILKKNPVAVILIDSPDFHLMLAKNLRRCGYSGKIISLVPPTVWAWRSGRVKNLIRDYDFCLPLFYFEHEYLISHGAKSYWTAHPLVHDLKNYKLTEKFTTRFKNDPVIALMPGSRAYDIKFHLEILLKTAEILRKKNYRPVFSVARGLSDDLAQILREKVSKFKYDIWEYEGRELMSGALAVAGVSGTVAVEAMLLNKFMVVIYNMKKFTHWLLKKLVHVKKISIPNYLSVKPIYPELICGDAQPEKIVSELEKYLLDENLKNEIDSRLTSAKNLMGNSNAAEFWAECVKKSLN